MIKQINIAESEQKINEMTKQIVDKAKAEVKMKYGNKKRHRQ